MTVDSPQIVVGILGAFLEHIHMLNKIPQVKQAIPVRTEQDLDRIDALILPGGESTSMGLIAERCGLLEPLRSFVLHKPTWGTCAGMILLAKEAHGAKRGGQRLLGALDVVVSRNQFGSQKDSFRTALDLDFLREPLEAVFIRAPVISEVLSSKVKIVGRLEHAVDRTEATVAVVQDHLLATAFHPELTEDTRLHQYFVNMALDHKLS